MLKFRAMNILLAIVVAFTILPTLPVYAEPSNDVDEVKQTLNQALEYKYDGYVSSDPDEAKKALKSLHATEKSFKDVEDEIDRERKASLQARLNI